RIRQDEIKEKLSELEIQRDDWEGRVERIISIVDSLKDFKSKFIEVDDQKKNQMLRLMTRKIIAIGEKRGVHGRKEALMMLKLIWNDEFQELFEIGLVKTAEKWNDTEGPKYQIPNNIRASKKGLTFYYQ
ncbi:MAG: hypothetical protein WA915_10840, partial [Candidatus Aminicenantaceae bacterium]